MTTEKIAEKTVEKVPSWLKSILLPEINEIKGDIKAVNNRIDALDDKIDTKITALDGKIDSLDDRMNTRITSLDEKIGSLRNETKSDIAKAESKYDQLLFVGDATSVQEMKSAFGNSEISQEIVISQGRELLKKLEEIITGSETKT